MLFGGFRNRWSPDRYRRENSEDSPYLSKTYIATASKVGANNKRQKLAIERGK